MNNNAVDGLHGPVTERCDFPRESTGGPCQSRLNSGPVDSPFFEAA